MSGKLRLFLISLLIATGFGCFGKLDVDKRSAFGKKYYLRECLVRVNYIWEPHVEYQDKLTITDKVSDEITRMMASDEFPRFSGHTTREKEYYVLYFADRCEDRLV